jgi:hypothetical protein
MTWVRARQGAGTRKSAAQVPEGLRREVTRRGEELVARKFTPLLNTEPSIRKRDFNYAVAVFTEWRGRSFYLCTRYRTPQVRPIEEFVVRSARLEFAGQGRFHLSYFRHTDRWQALYHGLTLDQCFDTIEECEVFWPLT